MEIKINKEIRSYSEGVFLGLSMRQFAFSLAAVVTAVILYFSFRDSLSKEALSWLIIASCAPFAFLGFFTYNGLSAEKAALAYIRCEITEPKFLPFEGRDLYAELLAEGR